MTTLEPCAQISDDIYQVRIPLPFALNIVNCYLIQDEGGWTLFDTGINTEPARATWYRVFDDLGIRPGDLRQIVLTHVHPDHYGLAGWLQNRAREQGTDLLVYMSPREAELADIIWGQGVRASQFVDFLTACGMPESMADPVATGIVNTRQMTLPHPDQVELLHPGGSLRVGKRHFQVIHAPGHSDGQIIFYDGDDRVMLSGDQILMKITPNIGLWLDTEPDPLGRYLNSLSSLKTYDVRLALPGHKTLITDWQGRLSELQSHHAARLEHTVAACNGAGTTVYEASLKVFDSSHFSTHEWRFAMVETLAHLEYLVERGRLRREEGTVWRYRLA